MLDHLVDMKCVHWDEKIRVLASEALLRIAPFEPEYCRSQVCMCRDYGFDLRFQLVPRLLHRLKTTDIPDRHGAIYALSSIVEALCSSGHFPIAALDELPAILDIVPQNFAALRNRRAQGATLLMKALSRFVKALCSVNVPLTDENVG